MYLYYLVTRYDTYEQFAKIDFSASAVFGNVDYTPQYSTLKYVVAPTVIAKGSAYNLSWQISGEGVMVACVFYQTPINHDIEYLIENADEFYAFNSADKTRALTNGDKDKTVYCFVVSKGALTSVSALKIKQINNTIIGGMFICLIFKADT